MNLKQIYKKIYKQIQKYEIIYIVRHIGPDPDAITSQMALKESIKLTFPKKKVYALGAQVNKFKYLGKIDKVDKIDYDNSLLITVDVPDKVRVDVINFDKFKHIIKIDHHPFIESFSDLEAIAICTSAAEMIYSLILNTKLKMNREIASLIFLGIVSDSYRFMFSPTNASTFYLVYELVNRFELDIQELYSKLYKKPLSEIRLHGFISENLKVNKNGFAHIFLDQDLVSSLGADISSASNMINDFNNVDEILVWVFVSWDEKAGLYKLNIRSRGPVINEIAGHYGGGGHIYASGARIKEKENVDKLLEELNNLCDKYKESEK